MFIKNRFITHTQFTQQQEQRLEESPHFEPLQDIVATQLEVETEEVTPPKEFVNDLGADSLDVVEIIMNVEEHFELSIPEEDMENVITVGDMVRYLDENVESDGEFSDALAQRGIVL